MDNLEQFILAIGAISEMAGLLRDSLMKNGFTRGEAVAMATVVVENTFTGAGTNDKDI